MSTMTYSQFSEMMQQSAAKVFLEGKAAEPAKKAKNNKVKQEPQKIFRFDMPYDRLMEEHILPLVDIPPRDGYFIPKDLLWDSRLSSSQKLFLVKLSEYCDEFGRVFFTNNEMAEFFEYNASHIRDMLANLKKHGYVSTIKGMCPDKVLEPFRIIVIHDQSLIDHSYRPRAEEKQRKLEEAKAATRAALMGDEF